MTCTTMAAMCKACIHCGRHIDTFLAPPLMYSSAWDFAMPDERQIRNKSSTIFFATRLSQLHHAECTCTLCPMGAIRRHKKQSCNVIV